MWYLTTFVYKSRAAERLGVALEILGRAESVKYIGSKRSGIIMKGWGL